MSTEITRRSLLVGLVHMTGAALLPVLVSSRKSKPIVELPARIENRVARVVRAGGRRRLDREGKTRQDYHVVLQFSVDIDTEEAREALYNHPIIRLLQHRDLGWIREREVWKFEPYSRRVTFEMEEVEAPLP